MDVQKLREIIEPNVDTPASRAFDLTIQAFILLAIVNFSVDTLPGLSDGWQRFLYGVEVVTVIVFSVEYLLRIWLAERRLKFVFSFFGMIDLLAILPFYINLGVDLRSLRILRLFRLFRVFKLLRYSAAANHFRRALREVREEMILYIIATGFLMFLASAGIYHFEHEVQPEHFQSIFHAMWWSVVTLTTVGYGDAYPITVGGRIFTGFMLLLGIGVISIPSGLIASGLTKTQGKTDDD